MSKQPKNKLEISVNVFEGILDFIFDTAQLLPLPLETPYMWARRMKKYEPGRISHALTRMRHKKLIRVYKIKNQTFLQLTREGQLYTLLRKSVKEKPVAWDGKWRLLVFDIPESLHSERDQFRRLLKRIGFFKLQASVFISPYPVSTAAIDYIKQSGLIEFIRIMRVDFIDDEKDLIKYFKLKR